MRIYKIGTRKSRLAMAQTLQSMEYIQAMRPDFKWELVGIDSQGDVDRQTSLRQLGGQGIFVKQLEAALVSGQIDMAVHSLKDVPTRLPLDLMLGGYLPRQSREDVLIISSRLPKVDQIEKLPSGLRIGTGSLRRQYQCRALLKSPIFVDIRGNIDTRLGYLQEELDGIILAKAGLERLMPVALKEHNVLILSDKECLPSPGQGCIGIEIRKKDEVLCRLLEEVTHLESKRQVLCERAFLEEMDSGCRLPIGAMARGNQQLVLEGYISDGTNSLRMTCQGEEPEKVGKELAQKMKLAGGYQILENMNER